ncbi:MAG: glycosyltransferase [Nitrososphaerota archaeon]|nr:glycosyltransferase [Candidatus Aenigmarchaeota archaeon]MDW8034702.1 glycosyltransferase [Nitrososphaerota archaeon]
MRTYSSSKVFIFLSRIEGAGIVIADAMGAGLPVVARNLPAYKTIYSGAPALYLLENDEDFYMRIVTLLNIPEFRYKMGLANRIYAIFRGGMFHKKY